MDVNEEKRKKFMEYAGKRVNNVLHDIQILEPMARSNSYDFTKQDVEEMFYAMQESLNNAKVEFEKKFEEKARTERKVFSFGASSSTQTTENINNTIVSNNENSTSMENNILEGIVEKTNNEENIDTNIFWKLQMVKLLLSTIGVLAYK